MLKHPSKNTYNYENFDLTFLPRSLNGPKIGDQAIDFSAMTLSGEIVRLSDYSGKIVVLETGSITCNIYVSKIANMNQLAAHYQNVVFLLLYTREAHPGYKISAHPSMQEKKQRALQLKRCEPEKRLILIDDLQGSAHTIYGNWPNMLYIISPEQKILYKDMWSSALRTESFLKAYLNEEIPNIPFIQQINEPKSRWLQLYTWWRVMHRAGKHAMRDFIREIRKARKNPDLKDKAPH